MSDLVPGATPVIERVRKLLAKAERSEHPHEAEAFATKAAQLIAAHRLTPESLAADRRSGRVRLHEIVLGRGAYVRARLRLLTEIATVHDADVVFRSGPAGMTAFVAGFGDDLEAIVVLYDSLHRQAASQMALQRRRTPAATQRFRRAFLFGFGERVGELLRATRADAERAGGPSHLGGPAGMTVALRARRQQVAELTARSFPRVVAASRPAPAGAQAWNRGRVAADRADLGRRRLDERRALGQGR